MTHPDMTNDFSAEENAEFAEIICDTYSEEEIALLEAEAENSFFQVDVDNVVKMIQNHADMCAGHTDIFVVAAALEIVCNEYKDVAKGD